MGVQLIGQQLERVTDAMRIITSDHGSIHAGEGFEASFVKNTIADNGKYNIAFTPPQNGKYIHFKFWKVWVSGAKVYTRIYEQAKTLVTAGDAVTPVNKNRICSITSATTVVEDATFDDTGATLLDIDIFGSGGTSPTTRQGGEGDKDIEWVFNPDKTYVFQFENKSGGTTDILLNTFWYEEAGA